VKLEVNHFHIFGFLVYIHLLVEKRTKLEPSDRNGLFVGYSETSKVYRVFIPEHMKTIVSQDVNIEEDFTSRKSHALILVIEDEEQKALKVELGLPVISKATQQPSGEEGEIGPPSTSIRRPQWFSQTLRDA
jgi:hypothetical protein